MNNMKKNIIAPLMILVIAAFCISCGSSNNEDSDNDNISGKSIVGGGNKNKDFKFEDGKISQEVLNNYLMRAITESEFLSSANYYNDGVYPYPDDDERMILNIGAKFIGRSLYSWNHEEYFNDPEWLKNAQDKMKKMHDTDPDIIFQAAIFETVSTKVNQISIPDWVFTAFNKTVEKRNFNFDDMKNIKGSGVGQWGVGTTIPDITREETRMFFYFMAVKYMEIGIEAIHFGQINLMAMDDINNNYTAWRDLLSKVRDAAKVKARRGTILCDGHIPYTANIAVDGNLLLDFGSFPMRIKNVFGDPEKGELKKQYLDAVYGLTVGGITPSGWSCTHSPYLVEFDNYGISNHPGVAKLDSFVWGYDEISWFYMQDTQYKNSFLKYAVNYLIKRDPLIGFLEMPGSRVVTTPYLTTRYRCNTVSDACPIGGSQESTIKEIWGN